MGKFKNFCKQLFRGKESAGEGSSQKDCERSQSLLKKIKNHLAKRSSPSLYNGHRQAETQRRGFHNGPAAENRQSQGQSPRPCSAQSSTVDQNFTSSRSSRSNSDQLPATFVCELPASYTFDITNVSSVRQEEANHWGGIASDIHRQQLEDPFYQLTLGTVPTKRHGSPATSTTQVTNVNAVGVFESSIKDTCDTSPTNPSTKGKDIQNENEDSGVGDVGGSGDKDSVKSQSPSSWERAMDSREQVHKNDIEDLQEDHAAEVEELGEKIARLEAQVKSTQARKALVEKNAKKTVAKKDAELGQQKALLDAEIASKDILLQEQATRIESLEISSDRYAELQAYARVTSLQEEIVRLKSLNEEQERRIKAQVTQTLLVNQRYAAELDARLAQGNIWKAQYEHSQNLYHQNVDELVKAKDQLNSQHIRLCEYRAEHEDHPACSAATDGLIKQKDEQYQLLEKKANETFLLWKKGNESHEHEKVMLGATIEELKARIDNLEGDVNVAQEESARSTSIAEDYINAQVENPDEVLRELYEAAKTTVCILKQKLANRNIQLRNVEKHLSEQRAEVKIRDLLLEKKETELRAMENEKTDAERTVENLESKLEFREADFQNELAGKDGDLQTANAKIDELQTDISAIAQAEEDTPTSARNEAFHQLEISKLHQHIETMHSAAHRRAVETHRRDFHETSCASSNALTWKIHAQNWENAQREIAQLKKHIQLIDQGCCDVEKFELAQRYTEVKEEKDTLERMLCEQMESMTTTMERHTAATKIRARKTNAEIRYLGEIAGNLCGYLREAWAVGGDDDVEDLSVEDVRAMHARLESLDEVRDGVERMMAGLSADEIDVDEEQGEEVTGAESEELDR
ncbi:MAG: hypothetical protein Q9216_003187 [Gyalolechia sp. 2 TL-2023]